MTADRPTMEDVATRAGVSRSLVSIVFRGVPGASEATRTRVRDAAAELGYVPDRRASRLGRARTRMIGVVFDVGGDFHAQVIDGMYAAAEAHGYEIVLSAATQRRDEAAAVRAVLAERCEAVVLVGPRLSEEDIADLAAGLPTLVLLRPLDLPGVDTIRTDEDAAMQLLIDHLHGLGHEGILHLDGGQAAAAQERRIAFEAAMCRHGLAPQITEGGWTEDAGAHAADDLFGLAAASRPSAVVAFNDRCALGVLHTARARGLVLPEDFSLTGFDDIAAASYRHTQLTTMRQDADLIGRYAVDQLRARLEARGNAEATERLDRLVAPSLVVRSSTGPARRLAGPVDSHG
ncbi:MAG: LacI family DNA-binding transcriptional regulator [Nostocoides sp.]